MLLNKNYVLGFDQKSNISRANAYSLDYLSWKVADLVSDCVNASIYRWYIVLYSLFFIILVISVGFFLLILLPCHISQVNIFWFYFIMFASLC